MRDVTELREKLSEIWDGLRTGSIPVKEAAEFSNLAGKMINSAKTQLEYYALSKEAPNIPFLKGVEATVPKRK